MKQLRVDKANAELAKDKIEAKMQELNNEVEEKAKLLEDKEKVSILVLWLPGVFLIATFKNNLCEFTTRTQILTAVCAEK